MDHRRFDLLTRAFGEPRSRRRLLLGAIAAIAGLPAVADDDLAQARGKHKKKKCRPEPRGKTCLAAQCGSVTNNCKKTVNCGDCPAGQSCNAGRCQTSCMPTTCAEQGIVCGTAGDRCGATMQCGDCPNGKECQGGACSGICKVLGDSCTGGGECCSGSCGTLGSGGVGCCTPDQQVAVGAAFCCNGNNATYNQGGTVYCGAPACVNDIDCNSNQPCMVDTCNQGTGQCVHTPVAGCCTSEAQCDDAKSCTVDTCVNNACVHTDQPNGASCSASGRICCQGRCCTEGKQCINGNCPAVGGCFEAGTRVAMADGTSKPIELVEIGDRVLGRNGQTNKVLDLLRPLLGERPLYALNGGPAFVTAGHPFLTEEGWKAVDPAAASEETCGLSIGQLQVGDAVLSLAGVAVAVGGGAEHGASDIRLAPRTIESIDWEAAAPTTPLFNLHVSGNHTYFADDLLVHNKIRKSRARH